MPVLVDITKNYELLGCYFAFLTNLLNFRPITSLTFNKHPGLFRCTLYNSDSQSRYFTTLDSFL